MAPRWLWVVRLTAIASLLLVFLALYRQWLDPCSGATTLWAMSARLFSMLSCTVILYRLSENTENRVGQIKKGLAWAIGTGLSLFFIAALAFQSYMPDFEWMVLLALLQVVFVVSAVKSYYTAQAESSDWRKLFLGVLGPCGMCFFLFASTLAIRESLPESSAAATLRQIGVAQITYFSTYPEKGFAVTLTQLGPPLAGGVPDEDARRPD